MEKFNFVGKNLNNDKKKEAADYLRMQKNNSNSSGKYNNELEKTIEDKNLINETIVAINTELKELNLPSDFIFEAERVHFFDKLENKVGSYNTINQHIEVAKESNDSLPLKLGDQVYRYISLLNGINAKKKREEFDTLIHESVHAASHHKHKVDLEKRTLGTYRIGYNLSTENHDYFIGLNEAVVTETTKDILFKTMNIKAGSIWKKMEDKLYRISSGYRAPLDILEVIIDKIAKEKNEDRSEVWNRFKRGQFTGEMMHLRDIEKIYGPGSLRVLATMDPNNLDSHKVELYKKYFSEIPSNIRNIIAYEILSDDHLSVKKYYNHKNKM